MRLQEAAAIARLTAEIKQHKRRCLLRKEEKTSFQRLAAAPIQKERQRPGRKNFVKISPVVTVTRTKIGRITDFQSKIVLRRTTNGAPVRGKESPKAGTIAPTRERLKERTGIVEAEAWMRGAGEALAQVTAVPGKGKEEKVHAKALVKSGTGKMKPEAPAQMCTERRKSVKRAMGTSWVKGSTEKGADAVEAEAERGRKTDSVGDRCKQECLPFLMNTFSKGSITYCRSFSNLCN